MWPLVSKLYGYNSNNIEDASGKNQIEIVKDRIIAAGTIKPRVELAATYRLFRCIQVIGACQPLHTGVTSLSVILVASDAD